MHIKFLKDKLKPNKHTKKERLCTKVTQMYYQSLLEKCQDDTCTWQIMKEITGKIEHNFNKFPNLINVNNKAIKKYQYRYRIQ